MISSFGAVNVLSDEVLFFTNSVAKQMQIKYRPDTEKKLYTFNDVQGVDEAKEEVQEVVEFLKYPEKFQRLGARLPTGKTKFIAS